MHGAVGDRERRGQVGAVVTEELEDGAERGLVVGQFLVDVELALFVRQDFVVDGAHGPGGDALHKPLGKQLLVLGVDHLVLDGAGPTIEDEDRLGHLWNAP